MDVPVEQIDAAVRELRQNPFDPTDHNPHLNVDILSAAEEPINLTRREEEQSQEDQARAYVTSAELSSGYSHNTVEIRFPGGGQVAIGLGSGVKMLPSSDRYSRYMYVEFKPAMSV